MGREQTCWLCGDAHTEERHAAIVRQGVAEWREGRVTTADDARVLSQEDGPYYAAPHRYSHAGHGRWWCPDCLVWIRNADCPRNQKWLADMAVLND